MGSQQWTEQIKINSDFDDLEQRQIESEDKISIELEMKELVDKAGKQIFLIWDMIPQKMQQGDYSGMEVGKGTW